MSCEEVGRRLGVTDAVVEERSSELTTIRGKLKSLVAGCGVRRRISLEDEDRSSESSRFNERSGERERRGERLCEVMSSAMLPLDG